MTASTNAMAFFVVLGLSASAAQAHAGLRELETAQAVIEADKQWGAAEVRGDTDFVRRLLLPEYVSVSPTGKVTTGEAIVEHAAARGNSKAYADKVAAWKAAHPRRPKVTLNGDIAVLTWLVGTTDIVASCDVFVLREGRWRALYSQHAAPND